MHSHKEILLSYEKGAIAIWDNMDGPRDYYAIWNKSGRERQILYGFIYMIALTYGILKTNKQKTRRYRENLVGYQRMSELGWVNKMGEGGQL